MDKELLQKFLNNTCSGDELDEVIKWVNTNSSNEEIKGWILEDWSAFKEPDSLKDDERFSDLFDKIQIKIDQNINNTERLGKSITLNGFTNWLTRAAAILLIPVLAFSLYTFQENRLESAKFVKMAADSLEVIAPIGSRTVVHLSDGSTVHLNYGSKIKYPRFFAGETRVVTLTGEGYFQVAHNPEQPFIVKAGNLNVEAVGTSFNVSAYPGANVFEATLVNGKVLLTKNDTNGKKIAIGAMVPGQHVVYESKTGAVSSASGNVEKYIAWVEGKLFFVDTPITQIAEKLNRMFNVDIEVQDNVKNLYYTFTLVDEPLYQILDLMTIATPVVSYKIMPRKRLPDGSFSKQVIIIEKKK
jgi:hypothetical protein